MKEAFLQYLWKFQKISASPIYTSCGKTIKIIQQGSHNTENSGPDFFNAQLIIDNQRWAGNIEIHIKSSDWYVHNHQNDAAYDNVILHVVWEHDIEIFQSNNISIPTLSLKPITSQKTLNQYHSLLKSKTKWINCSGQLHNIDQFTWDNWLERLYLERLSQKSIRVNELLLSLNNHWEATCFCLIAQYFGGNHNGDNFLTIAKSIPFNVLQKTTSILQLEALLFGQANLLNSIIDDTYYISLQKEYQYLKHKYNLTSLIGLELQFFRLRPPNFPTIRLAQLAQLYKNQHQLFSIIKEEFNHKNLHSLFTIRTSKYWETHYTFGKESKRVTKKVSTSFIDLLIINAISPLQLSLSNEVNKDIQDQIIQLITTIKAEKNSIVSKFKSEKLSINNALQSQGAIHLKKEFCEKNYCLKCGIGFKLLKD